jgi:hypothetical protein
MFSQMSSAEYLELEPKAEFKSEYLQGEMFAMAAASPQHRSGCHRGDGRLRRGSVCR